MKKLHITLFFCAVLLIFGACSKKDEVKGNVTLESDKEESSKIYSGETIIEAQTDTENGYYLSWYDDTDTLLIGLLPKEFVTEYNYPEGTKVRIEAVNDGTVTTVSGKEAYKISSIEYVEDIPATTEEEAEYTESLEGVVYVEEQVQEDGQTYLVFTLESDPNYYYYGKITNPDANMADNNYYIYAVYNKDDLRNDKQYCEITSWENKSYDSSYVDNSSSESESVDNSQPEIKEEYDSAFYSEETGIWLVGNTTSNGKPFILDGIEELYIEDGYLYFIGRIHNTVNKDYKVILNVAIKDKDGNLLADVSDNNTAFTYKTSKELVRSERGYTLISDDLSLDFYVPANGTAYFTDAEYEGFSPSIDDQIDIRSWNSEPYYIYVTIRDYKDK